MHLARLISICTASLGVAASACDSTLDDGPDGGGGSGLEEAECEAGVERCTGADVCVEDACVPLVPRTYLLTFSLVTINELADTDNQVPWDGDASAPDPYALVTLDGAEVLRTEVTDDTFGLALGELDVDIVDIPSRLTVALFDDDGAVDEMITFCGFNLFEPLLRHGSHTCASSRATDLVIDIAPQ